MNKYLTGNFFDALQKHAEDALERKHIDRSREKKLNEVVQAFMLEPRIELKKIKEKIQAIGVSVTTDFQQVVNDAFNVTMQSQNYDMGWEPSFKLAPVAKGQDSWDIYDVANTINFIQMEEGQKLDCQGFTGTRTAGQVHYFGAAIGWTDAWMRFRKVAAMVDKAEAFRNQFWTSKANYHYALLAVAAALNITLTQGVAADGQLRQDVRTINQAIYNVTFRCRNKGYGDMANAPVIMYANRHDEERIEAAFRATTATLGAIANRGEAISTRRVSRIYTYNNNVIAGFPMIVIPENKIQRAEVMGPTIYNQEVDILTLNRVQAMWAIYGAIVADTDQCELITLA